MKPYLIIARHPYEELYHTSLVIQAHNGRFSGELEIFIGVDELMEIGNALSTFPNKTPDEYKFLAGDEDNPEDFAYFFSLKIYTIDSVGHCAIQVSFNSCQQPPDEGIAKFSIEANPSAINELGKALIKMQSFENSAIRWTPEKTEFHEEINA